MRLKTRAYGTSLPEFGVGFLVVFGVSGLMLGFALVLGGSLLLDMSMSTAIFQ